MKKKTALIIAVIVVCSVLGVIANNYQKKLATKEVEKEKITVAEDNSKENTKQISESSLNQNQNDTSTSIKQDDKTSENKISSSSSTSTTTQKPQNTTNSISKQVVATTPAPTPIKQPDNFFIIDSVNNKVIYSSREDFAGKTADKLTIDVLNRQKINKLVSTSLSGTYFSSIADLAERSAGEKSGWCYFINGQKLPVSSSSYTLKVDDKIEWKFMKDGTSK